MASSAALCLSTQVAQAQVMRQQFLKGKPLLTRVRAGQQSLCICVGWRPMQIINGVGQRWHAEFLRNGRREEFLGRCCTHLLQGLIGKTSQSTLLHPLGTRINCGQRIVRRRTLVITQDAVLGVDHLEAGLPAADLAEAGNVHAGLELCLLLAREMKEAKR